MGILSIGGKSVNTLPQPAQCGLGAVFKLLWQKNGKIRGFKLPRFVFVFAACRWLFTPALFTIR
jgi:hypothetical protein